MCCQILYKCLFHCLLCSCSLHFSKWTLGHTMPSYSLTQFFLLGVSNFLLLWMSKILFIIFISTRRQREGRMRRFFFFFFCAWAAKFSWQFCTAAHVISLSLSLQNSAFTSMLGAGLWKNNSSWVESPWAITWLLVPQARYSAALLTEMEKHLLLKAAWVQRNQGLAMPLWDCSVLARYPGLPPGLLILFSCTAPALGEKFKDLYIH